MCCSGRQGQIVTRMIVPIQASIVLSILYKADVNSGTNHRPHHVSDESDDFKTALMYTGLDLGIERFCAFVTLVTLRLMFLN